MAYIGRDTDKISNVEVLDNITFDGSSSYTLQKGGSNFTPSSANTILLSIDGVVQAGNFTVSGSTIDFGTAVDGTSTCDFILHYGVGLITTVSDGTVTTAKLADSSVTTAKLSGALVTPSTLDVNGNELILDADGDTSITADTDDQIDFKTGGTDRASIDSSGNVKFNSGFGSVGFAYGVRAWVVFDGNNGAIQADGNVSSVTRFGTGNYRVNFSNNMPDINYSVTGSTIGNNYGTRQTFVTGDGGLKNVAYVNVQVVTTAPADHDNNRVNITVVR